MNWLEEFVAQLVFVAFEPLTNQCWTLPASVQCRPEEGVVRG